MEKSKHYQNYTFKIEKAVSLEYLDKLESEMDLAYTAGYLNPGELAKLDLKRIDRMNEMQSADYPGGVNYYTHNAELELINTRELHEFIKPYFKDENNDLRNLSTFLSTFFRGYFGFQEKTQRPIHKFLSKESKYFERLIDFDYLAKTLKEYFSEV